MTKQALDFSIGAFKSVAEALAALLTKRFRGVCRFHLSPVEQNQSEKDARSRLLTLLRDLHTGM